MRILSLHLPSSWVSPRTHTLPRCCTALNSSARPSPALSFATPRLCTRPRPLLRHAPQPQPRLHCGLTRSLSPRSPRCRIPVLPVTALLPQPLETDGSVWETGVFAREATVRNHLCWLLLSPVSFSKSLTLKAIKNLFYPQHETFCVRSCQMCMCTIMSDV